MLKLKPLTAREIEKRGMVGHLRGSRRLRATFWSSLKSKPVRKFLRSHITLQQAKCFATTLAKGDPNETGVVKGAVRQVLETFCRTAIETPRRAVRDHVGFAKCDPTVSRSSKADFPCSVTRRAPSGFNFHHFRADEDRLGGFLDMLSTKRRYSFEFRHPSWYAPRILRMLAEQNISLGISDHHDAPSPWRRTANFVYVRGHGPSGRYKGHYTDQTLLEWAGRIRSWKKQGKDVYVYFDNDQKSAAPADALQLRRILIVPPSSSSSNV